MIITTNYRIYKLRVVEIFDQSQELVRSKTRVFFNSGNPTKLEKEMAIHSSMLAWKIPWTGHRESDTTE